MLMLNDTIKQLSLWIFLITVFSTTGGCSSVLGIDDECNEDVHCTTLGVNLKCIQHMCVEGFIDNQSSTETSGTDDSSSDKNQISSTDTLDFTSDGTDTDQDALDSTSINDTGTDTGVDTAETNTDLETADTQTATGISIDTGSETLPDGDSESNGNNADTADTDTLDDVPVFTSFPFTDGFDGFAGSGYTHDSENGWLEIEHKFTGPNQTLDLQVSFSGEDWSGVSALSAVVKVEKPILGGLQIFVSSGSTWAWCATWNDIAYMTDKWTTLTTEIAGCSAETDMSLVRSVGLQIRSGSTDVGAQTIKLLVDEIYASGSPTDQNE